MITIQIPNNITEDWKYEFFPKVSMIIMKEFYKAHKEDERLIVPKNMKFSFYHNSQSNGKPIVDLVKIKTRIKMPKDATYFMIDVAYVKNLEKVVKEKSKLYATRGILMFPVIDDNKIYMINIKKLDKEMRNTQFVNNTYSESNVLREGDYYYIPKNICTAYNIENIEFVKVDLENEKETEINNKNNLF